MSANKYSLVDFPLPDGPEIAVIDPASKSSDQLATIGRFDS